MKNFSLSLLLAAALFASCKPDEQPPVAPPGNDTLPCASPPCDTIPQPEMTDGIYSLYFTFQLLDSTNQYILFLPVDNDQVSGYIGNVCVKRFDDYFLLGRYTTIGSAHQCIYCDSCRLHYKYNTDSKKYFSWLGNFKVNDILPINYSSSLNAYIYNSTIGDTLETCACDYKLTYSDTVLLHFTGEFNPSPFLTFSFTGYDEMGFTYLWKNQPSDSVSNGPPFRFLLDGRQGSTAHISFTFTGISLPN